VETWPGPCIAIAEGEVTEVKIVVPRTAYS